MNNSQRAIKRQKNGELPSIEELRARFVYERATGKLRWWRPLSPRAKWLDEAGWLNSRGYRNVKVDSTEVPVHRIIWAMHCGEWPEDEIDHINGDKLDNRMENLRVVTRQENARNQKRFRTNTSGVVGVSWQKDKQKWRAYIEVKDRKIHRGYFDSKAEAIAARKDAEIEYGFHPNHGRKGPGHASARS